MEELSKTQIVLLTLLVSFVTSIATGIVTVALVDQSSQGVGATLQTVVEKTIQTVISGTSTSPDVVKVSTGGSGVKAPPSESDLIVAAVAKNSGDVVRIEQTNTIPGPSFVGLGLIVSKNGTIVADKGLLVAVNAKYQALLSDGTISELIPANISTSTPNIAVFTMSTSPSPKISLPILGDSSKLALGQRVISISGSDKDTINLGIISSLDENQDAGQSFIKTDFSISDLAYGSILLNLTGEVIGIKVGKSGEDNEFLSSNDLKAELGI